MAGMQRLMPHSITAQITGLVAISVMLGVTLLVANSLAAGRSTGAQ